MDKEYHFSNRKKILVIAPFWGRTDHVGVYRVERFLRWLVDDGYSVVIVTSGSKDQIIEEIWGKRIIIRDLISIITEFLISSAEKIRTKFFLYVWNTLIMFFLPPDETRLWAGRVAKNKLVKNELGNCGIIISSSPPHSSHLAAYNLSKNYNIPYIVDLRDGWLDEPLKPILTMSRIRNWFESNIEKKILSKARRIFVTSNEWESLLKSRLKELSEKICVLTNAYPSVKQCKESEQNSHDSKILRLIYAGRFTGSRYSQTLDRLFEPIYGVITKSNKCGEIILLGDLKRKDIPKFKYWKENLDRVKVKMINKPRVSREKLFEHLLSAQGLLLLSISLASIPSKLYEYIYTKKPILAVTLKNSAVWNLADKLPQMFLYDCDAKEKDYTAIINFFEACETGNYEYRIPNEFSEEYLGSIFLEELKNENSI